MKKTNIKCPYCSKSFTLSDAITNHMEKKFKSEQEQVLENFKNDLMAKEKKNWELIIKRKEREFNEKLADISLESDLKLETRLNDKLQEVYSKAKDKFEKEFLVKVTQKDQQIQELNQLIENLKKKSEQIPVQLQGETQEIIIEDLLREGFPDDEICPTPSGKRGADIKLIIKLKTGKIVGSILFESKRTKLWSSSWIAKLKEDQKRERASVSIIVSDTLPQDVKYFNCIQGVWVTDIKFVRGLTLILRESLITIGQIQDAQESQSSSMELIYSYLTGNQFRQRIESLCEVYISMRDELESEKRAHEKFWSKKEKQLLVSAKNMAGIYGDLQGLGAALQDIKLLEMNTD